MLTWVFLKAAADLSFYYTFIGPIAFHFGAESWVLFCHLALLAVCFSLSYLLRERGALRFLPLLLILTGVFFPGAGLAGRLALIPPSAYLAYLTARRLYEPAWEQQVDIFSLFWKAFLLYFVFSILFRVTHTSQQIIAVMGVISLVCSVLIMRALRHESAVYLQRRYQLTNLTAVAGAVAAAGLLSTEAFLRGCFSVIRVVYRAVMGVLLRGIELLLMGIDWLLHALPFGSLQIQNETNRYEIHMENLQPITDAMGEGSPIVDVILTVIAVLLLALVLFLLFRFLSRRGRTARRVEFREQRFDLNEERKEPENHRGSPVQRVRQQYRRFLRLCIRYNRPVKKDDTSLDVLERSSDLFERGPSAELREIYIRARYNDQADKADAVRARELYAELKRSVEKENH